MYKREKTSWRKLIEKALLETKENFDDLIITLSNEELDAEFDNGYGSPLREPFTAWSKDYLYFRVCHDGAEWVEYVARNPNDKPTEHIGGY